MQLNIKKYLKEEYISHLHSKGSHKQYKKIIHRMRENMYKWYNQEGISLQNLQIAHVAQNKKNKQLNQKMGTGPK